MKTDVWKIRGLVTSRLVAIVAACSLLASCDDGPTAPSARAVPTPAPIPNVAGAWDGRYNAGGGNIFFCGGTVPATATLSQDGVQVFGTVRTQNARLDQAAFLGSLDSGQLRGTLTVNGTVTRVTGAAAVDHLTMTWNVFLCGTNTIDLRRQP